MSGEYFEAGLQILSPNAQYAIARAKAGHPVAPGCAAVEGRCGFPTHCGGGWDQNKKQYVAHEGRDVGKAPITALVRHGHKDASTSVGIVTGWWLKYPLANVLEPIEPNNWVMLDPDTDQAQAEAHKLGIPNTLTRRSRQNAFLFDRPADCPTISATKLGKSGAIDLKADGYIATFGTHQKGHRIELLPGETKPTPRWAVEWLQQAAARRDAKRSVGTSSATNTDEPPVLLNDYGLKVWRGEIFKAHPDGKPERSGSLIKIGRALYDAGATRRTLVTALAERDESLGWQKYSRRPDADAQYHAIVNLLEGEGRNAKPIELEPDIAEQQAAVKEAERIAAGSDLVCIPKAEHDRLTARLTLMEQRVAEYWTLLVQQQGIIRNASFTPGKRIALLGALMTIGEAEERQPGQEHVYHRGLVATVYNVSKDLAGEASAILEQLGVIQKRSDVELVTTDFKTGEPLPKPAPHVITRVRPLFSKLDAWSTVASFSEPRPERAKIERGKPKCPRHATAETTLAYICTVCKLPVTALNPAADAGFDAVPALCTEKSSIGLTAPGVVTPALVGDSSVHRDESHTPEPPDRNPAIAEAEHELVERGRLLGFPELPVAQGWGIAAGEEAWGTFARRANGRLGFALDAAARAQRPINTSGAAPPPAYPEASL